MKPTEKPQHELVLEKLQQGYYLTSLDALKELGIISFPKRISTLRNLGHKIEQESITVKGRFGKKRISRYWMIPIKP